MNRPRRILSLPLTALVVLSSSVFLFGSTASAQALEVRPLSANDQIIQQNATEVAQKSGQLNLTSSELDQLQARKDALAQQLDSEKKAVEELKAKIAAKKEADAKAAEEAAQAAKAVPVQSTPVYTASVSAPTGAVSGCGDNFYANYIYMHESGCRTHNPNGSGCDGIGQACPASKVIGPCGYDYACQNAWFTEYANKYGGWAGAYQFWLANGWW